MTRCVKGRKTIPDRVVEITGLQNAERQASGCEFKDLWAQLCAMLQKEIGEGPRKLLLVGYNSHSFDVPFLLLVVVFEHMFPGQTVPTAHRAAGDVEMLAKIFYTGTLRKNRMGTIPPAAAVAASAPTGTYAWASRNPLPPIGTASSAPTTTVGTSVSGSSASWSQAAAPPTCPCTPPACCCCSAFQAGVSLPFLEGHPALSGLPLISCPYSSIT